MQKKKLYKNVYIKKKLFIYVLNLPVVFIIEKKCKIGRIMLYILWASGTSYLWL